MSARRGASGLSGILAVDKPPSMTSHDVVDAVRRATGERRVGHAGTLDPMATGLLVVLVGPAARLAPYLTSESKGYDARIVFGFETDTDDSTGLRTITAEVPPHLADPSFAEKAVAAMVGTHEQVPPAYSAIKENGRKAYERARAGEDVELEPRIVDITAARLIDAEAGPPIAWDAALTVSKGTYVRAVARDIGRHLGTAAHLGALRRTHSGYLSLGNSRPLARIEEAGPDHVAGLFADPVVALGFPAVEVSENDSVRVANGTILDAAVHGVGGLSDGLVSIVRRDRLLAVYEKTDGRLRAVTVIPGGVGGAR
ncbi:MAG: tRNA pseudouridine(55) synthase TruB [Coriobacteriales bacterium]|nr:tRNA pseudouridine(55) synthase TruB [Coriobacteriales bacterium]